MSQRDSGYERKERDLYETPEWVTYALAPALPRIDWCIAWEPACGSGKMERALEEIGFCVIASDIESGSDFLTAEPVYGPGGPDCIITNPPYALAQEFVERAIKLMQPVGGFVAMLLRTDFDHAKTRQHLFGQCPQFSKKLVLTKRIRWFEDSNGNPSFNHAWYIWDWQHQGPPTLAYGP